MLRAAGYSGTRCFEFGVWDLSGISKFEFRVSPLRAPIQWAAGEWHQVALTWTYGRRQWRTRDWEAQLIDVSSPPLVLLPVADGQCGPGRCDWVSSAGQNSSVSFASLVQKSACTHWVFGVEFGAPSQRPALVSQPILCDSPRSSAFSALKTGLPAIAPRRGDTPRPGNSLTRAGIV